MRGIRTLFNLCFLAVTLISSQSCSNDDEPNPIVSSPDGYNQVEFISEGLDLDYLFAHTVAESNSVYINSDSVFMELYFYKDSASFKTGLNYFKMKFFYHKGENKITNASLIAAMVDLPQTNVSGMTLGKLIAAPSGIIEKFVPVDLMTSNLSFSEMDSQISFDYTTQVKGSDNSLFKDINLNGSLLAKYTQR